MKKIAITVLSDSNGKGISASMDESFGHAEAFVIVNRENGEVVETFKNPFAAADYGAGISAAKMLSTHDVSEVVSGQFGFNATDALKHFGMKPWVAPTGVTVKDALTMLKDHVLEAPGERPAE